MRIGVVGGVERCEPVFREIAERAGHTLAYHGGHMGGSGANALAELVARSHLVIVTTDVNSHGAVQLTRRLARKAGVPIVLHRRCSPARFAAIVAGLESPEPAVAAAR
jgi:hypothetical protein